MYEQETNFYAAKTPLFTQLFGHNLTPIKSVKNYYYDNKNCYSHSPCLNSKNEYRKKKSNESLLPIDVTTISEYPHNSTSSSNINEKKDFLKTQEVSNNKDTSDNDNNNNDSFIEKEEFNTFNEPKVPFRQVMGELEKRFREQIEVHRGLNSSIKELNVLQSEISLFKTEQRTVHLAAALEKKSLSSIKKFSNVSPSSTVSYTQQNFNTNSTNNNSNNNNKTPTPLLERILKSYTKERSHNSTVLENIPLSLVDSKQKVSIEIVRPPEEPQPYKRIIYVPIVKEVKNENLHQDSSFSNSSGIASSISTTVSYSEDFNSTGGVSTDLSVSTVASYLDENNNNNNSSSSVETENVNNIISSSSIISSVSGLTPITAYDSVVDTSENIISNTSGNDINYNNKRKNFNSKSSDGKALIETLKEFYRACGNANRLMQIIIKSDKDIGSINQSLLISRRRSPNKTLSEREVQKENNNDNDDYKLFLSKLKRDVGDIKKLHRFIDHLKSNIKTLDCQRKAEEVRRKLLIKAQRLAKAQYRMKNDKNSNLSDIIDDIVDLIGSESSKGDSGDILDEVATNISFEFGNNNNNSSSIEDEISDEVEDNNSNFERRSNDIDDEIIDELDESGKGININNNIDDDFDIPDEVASNLSWVKAENDFAETLAVVSDINEIIDNDLPLPSDDIDIETEIMEEISNHLSVLGSEDNNNNKNKKNLNKSKKENDIITNNNNNSEIDKKPRFSLNSVSIEDEISENISNWSDTNDDADVSSVLPASSSFTTSSSSIIITNNIIRKSNNNNNIIINEYNETESEESALDALEEDLKVTEPRRVLALSSVHPSTFTPLYFPDTTETTEIDIHHLPENNNNNNNNKDNINNSISSTMSKESKSLKQVVNILHDDKVESPVMDLNINSEPKSFSSSLTKKYAADDLLAQLNWKERQLALFKELRPKPAWIQKEENNNNKEENSEEEIKVPVMELPVEGRAEYHWGMVETLLQCRFAVEPIEENNNNSISNNSSWINDSEIYDIYSSSEREMSMGDELSVI